ncbi:hypothetical protein QAD02_012861 [Eretmocerus hayati]|uniref:Uncharacterized protein n=1 Tax=Eretmocerus hayati TaxID=131215 RepID=A0ACC2P3G1_9HYME|nr:hypothetical protein QAD02_012861 [Eretmocerus hayati]
MVRYTRRYVCDRRSALQNAVRIGGEENVGEAIVCVARRDGRGLPPQEVILDSRICFNCHQSIQIELNVIQGNPSAVRSNVLRQTRNTSCVICNAVHDSQRLSDDCKADVFLQCNIYMPEIVRSCARDLDSNGFLLPLLLPGLLSINRLCVIRGRILELFLQGIQKVAQNRNQFQDENCVNDEEFVCLTSVTKPQFEDMFAYCDRVAQQAGFRYVKREDLIMPLCKLRQGLSDEFLTVSFS